MSTLSAQSTEEISPPPPKTAKRFLVEEKARVCRRVWVEAEPATVGRITQFLSHSIEKLSVMCRKKNLETLTVSKSSLE